MYMLTLEEIVKRLKGSDMQRISVQTGINYQQVWRLANGIDKNPTNKTLRAFSDYFMEGEEEE